MASTFFHKGQIISPYAAGDCSAYPPYRVLKHFDLVPLLNAYYTSESLDGEDHELFTDDVPEKFRLHLMEQGYIEPIDTAGFLALDPISLRSLQRFNLL